MLIAAALVIWALPPQLFSSTEVSLIGRIILGVLACLFVISRKPEDTNRRCCAFLIMSPIAFIRNVP